jgi:hypothetical protein
MTDILLAIVTLAGACVGSLILAAGAILALVFYKAAQMKRREEDEESR